MVPVQISIFLALCLIDIRTKGAPANPEPQTHLQEAEVPPNTVDYDLIEAAKRAWKDLQGSGWGKRSWQDLQSSGWGKRSWKDLNGGWGKRGWQDLQTSGWGKRGWQDLQTSGWGKRAWKNLQSSGWGKRSNEKFLLSPEDIEILSNGDFASMNSIEDLAETARRLKLMREPSVDKRDASDWGSLKGAWGKRDPAWHNLKGLWGKRSLDNNRDIYHQDLPDARYMHSSENED